jgi:hypothetical protein
MCGGNAEKPPVYELTPIYAIWALQRRVVKGQTYGLPGTDGTFMDCLKHHILNEHTVLGIFYAHPLHPFSRKERGIFWFNAAAWVIFISAFTTGLSQGASIGITLGLVVPYKIFVRTIMECKCLYVDAFDPASEKDDGDDDPLNNDDHGTWGIIGQICELFGSFISLCLLAISVILLATAVSYIVQIGKGNEFAENWIISQVSSTCGTEIIMMAAFSFLAMYSLPIPVIGTSSEIAEFEELWRPHFQDKGLPAPVSLTDIGRQARKNYIKKHGQHMFEKKFAKFDEWFCLPPISEDPEVVAAANETAAMLQSGADVEAPDNDEMQERMEAQVEDAYAPEYVAPPAAEQSHDAANPYGASPPQAPENPYGSGSGSREGGNPYQL